MSLQPPPIWDLLGDYVLGVGVQQGFFTVPLHITAVDYVHGTFTAPTLLGDQVFSQCSFSGSGISFVVTNPQPGGETITFNGTIAAEPVALEDGARERAVGGGFST